jgi:hypothetical protein
MRIEILLSDSDRQRYGLSDEWLTLDPHTLTVREAVALQGIGFRSPNHWRYALGGLSFDESGAVVRGADGEPLKGTNYPAWIALVWLMLTRAGQAVKLDDIDFEYDSFGFREVETDDDSAEGGDSEGKATQPG